LRPRRQAIKYTSSYHRLTHTWGLRLKKLLNLRSGASPFGLRSGVSPFDLCSGASPFDLRSGALSFDLRSGASPFGLCSGAPSLDLHDLSKFVQHSKELPKIQACIPNNIKNLSYQTSLICSLAITLGDDLPSDTIGSVSTNSIESIHVNTATRSWREHLQ
jgi:hypothetical protein